MLIFLHNLCLRECDGPEPPSASIVCVKRTRRVCSCCRQARSLYPLECRLLRPAKRARNVYKLPLLLLDEPVPNSARFVLQSICRPCGTLIWPLLECVAPVPTAATVVRSNNGGRPFHCTTCSCLMVRDLDAVPMALSVWTAHVAYAAAFVV